LGISSPHESHIAPSILDGRRPLPLGDVIGLIKKKSMGT
jgi:hypothetical protein